MVAKVYSAVPRGVEALRVQVEVDARPGLPMFSVVGLPDPAVREARERVLAAIRHLGCQLVSKGPFWSVPACFRALTASATARYT